MQNYIEESLASDLIHPFTFPVGVWFVFVAKKDNTLRPCIDYWGLNQITVKNKYPSPLINSLYKQLHSATIFTKVDLRNTYHLVQIWEGDAWKTAFSTSLGQCEYLVFPFGMPAVFQALMKYVLHDFLNAFVSVYLDDILIYSKGSQQHTTHIQAVLQLLLENQLFVKAEWCEFHVSSVTFLGFIFENGQVRTYPDKIKAVAEWSVW